MRKHAIEISSVHAPLEKIADNSIFARIAPHFLHLETNISTRIQRSRTSLCTITKTINTSRHTKRNSDSKGNSLQSAKISDFIHLSPTIALSGVRKFGGHSGLHDGDGTRAAGRGGIRHSSSSPCVSCWKSSSWRREGEARIGFTSPTALRPRRPQRGLDTSRATRSHSRSVCGPRSKGG